MKERESLEKFCPDFTVDSENDAVTIGLTVPAHSVSPVSYTHLDVYKRQSLSSALTVAAFPVPRSP